MAKGTGCLSAIMSLKRDRRASNLAWLCIVSLAPFFLSHFPVLIFEIIDNLVNKVNYVFKGRKSKARSARALYIEIPKGYTPKGSIEKNYFIATKKRNLLLSNK